MKKIILYTANRFFTIALFFACLNANAQIPTFAWAKHISSASFLQSHSIANDNLNNIYTTGQFEGTADLDPGSGIFNMTSFQGMDAYISKISSNGNFIWAKQIGGGINCSVNSNSIAIDNFNNIFIAGSFNGTVDFDPGLSTYNLTSGFSQYHEDIFILKLDSSGNFIWAKQFGGDSNDKVSSMTLDLSGNIYTFGSFRNTADFDPGLGVFLLTQSSTNYSEIFISKLDSSGNFIWAKNIGAFTSGIDESIAIDNSENVYFTGSFFGTVDFDPGVGVSNLTSVNCNIFISKLNSVGDLVWAIPIEGIGCSSGINIKLDSFGNIYNSAQLIGTADFDPSSNVFNLTASSPSSSTIAKYDSLGNFIWAKIIGGNSGTIGISSFALDLTDNIYITGGFSGTIDFNPNIGINNLTTTSGCSSAVYILKLDSLGNFMWAEQFGGLSAAGWGIVLDSLGNIYTTGNFHGLADFDPSLGILYLNASITNAFIQKLSLCYPLSSLNSDTACNIYTLDGQIYNTSGFYTQTLVNSNGCDSIVNLNLTIISSSSAVLTQTSCNSFTIDGQILLSSGIYAVTLTNSVGCDSLLTLNLTINTVDVTVTQSSNTLTANEIGATYQWINCKDSLDIFGASNQSYTPTANGSYAVIVSLNGCTDTSACYPVTTIGIDDYDVSNLIQISPNPNQGVFTIEFLQATANSNISVYNTLGQLVYYSKCNFIPSELTIDISDKAKGIYFVEIIDGEKTFRKKLVKN